MVPLLLPAGYLIAQHTLHWTLYSTAIQKTLVMYCPAPMVPCHSSLLRGRFLVNVPSLRHARSTG